MKKEKKFIITCPYCGKELFKSRIADTLESELEKVAEESSHYKARK